LNNGNKRGFLGFITPLIDVFKSVWKEFHRRRMLPEKSAVKVLTQERTKKAQKKEVVEGTTLEF
jgi:hypothetical protein